MKKLDRKAKQTACTYASLLLTLAGAAIGIYSTSLDKEEMTEDAVAKVMEQLAKEAAEN